MGISKEKHRMLQIIQEGGWFINALYLALKMADKPKHVC
jgi:hypothetical protein